ncbi:MAG: NAD-dependent epimerase/dehydratase family protein [Patescibacteria group bacterium]
MKNILVTGAFGQIGSELVPALQKKKGVETVVASDIRDGLRVDVTDVSSLEKAIRDNKIDTIFHLAGLLSAAGERNPELAWQVNLIGLKNVLDLALQYKLRVFWPSSIAAFGPTTPREKTPQHTILEPTTMYGMNKVAGELLCQYYFLKYGLDVRSIRYPGLITYKTEPSDGTTEYSIAMFFEALRKGNYQCFLSKDTILPMMYIDDAIRGTIDLMEAPAKKISIRTSYNFSAMSFSPEELAQEINKHIPLKITYKPDFHQAIADSWPQSIDDSQARNDWGWKHEFDLVKMTKEMIKNLKHVH